MRLLAIARSRCRALAVLASTAPVSSHPTGHKFRLPLSKPRRTQARWLSTTGRILSSWQKLIDDSQISKLREAYPHIESPTPAQEALLKAMDGGKDIFLRDRMGRGKTFGLALSSINSAKKGLRTMILVPTPQLLDLIQNHHDTLSSDTSPINATSMIWLTTPKNALSDLKRENFSPDIIVIDEPETLLQPLPPRHLQGGALRSHPFHKHPPPLAALLDRLAKTTKGNTRMVWVGAEMNGLLKRTVRQRGWAGMDALELDFENGSARALKDIESVMGSVPEGGRDGAGEVEHLSFLVGEGGVAPHVADEAVRDMPQYRSGRPIIEDSIVQAVVRYQAEHPTPEDTTTLILPPEGYPLETLATRLTSFASSLQVPMSITTVASSSTQLEPNSILITPRSAVPGLDIPNLSRIILLNGLDLAGLSPAQRSRGGAKKRAAFYEIVSGRLGRLGSVTHDKGGQVVSFITEGSGEEAGMGLVVAQTSRRNSSVSIDRSHSIVGQE